MLFLLTGEFQASVNQNKWGSTLLWCQPNELQEKWRAVGLRMDSGGQRGGDAPCVYVLTRLHDTVGLSAVRLIKKKPGQIHMACYATKLFASFLL